jgi:hypothetical protein
MPNNSLVPFCRLICLMCLLSDQVERRALMDHAADDEGGPKLGDHRPSQLTYAPHRAINALMFPTHMVSESVYAHYPS